MSYIGADGRTRQGGTVTPTRFGPVQSAEPEVNFYARQGWVLLNTASDHDLDENNEGPYICESCGREDDEPLNEFGDCYWCVAADRDSGEGFYADDLYEQN